jgi:hypothetical protein
MASIEDRVELLRGVLDELRGEMNGMPLVDRLEELLDEIDDAQPIQQVISRVH